MYSLHLRRSSRLLVAMIVVLGALGWSRSTFAQTGGTAGAVYSLTNAPTGNAVVIWNRAADGTLVAGGSVSTGGQGSGDGLGSQGALVLSGDHQWLYAVNAGSNTVSVLWTTPTGLRLAGVYPSGGERPISLTVHNNLLYVLNAGGSGNIAGFRIEGNSRLSPLTDALRPLSNGGSGASVGPAQIAFSPDGTLLTVTEKNTNLIDMYVVKRNGRAKGPLTQPSSGPTPFGFGFANRDQLIVSEAFGGADNASAVSSYKASRNGNLAVVSGSAATGQTAACWIAVTEDGHYAYAANAGSGSISGYAVSSEGNLTLLNGDGRTAVDLGHPTDLALTANSQNLYVLDTTSGMPRGFRVGGNGSLAPLPNTTGLGAMVGLVAW